VSTNADLAIIGPVPPPHGGVSVHVERLLPHLDSAGIRWKLYNPAGPTSEPDRIESVAAGRAGWFVRYLLMGREKTIHLHASSWLAWAAIEWWERVRGKRVVLTVHSAVSRVLRGSSIRRALASRGLRSATAIIAVNADIRDELLECGVSAERVHVIEPFIPPQWGAPGEGVSADVVAFCASHSPVLLATGGAVIDQGLDVYGFDLALDLVERVRSRHPRIGLLWYLLRPLHRDRAHEDMLLQRAAEGSLSEHVHVEPATGPMHNAYGLTDVVVRPTSTDGDPLTIREAHSALIPTLVSDVCPRPRESVVFSSRNLDDFERGLDSVLESAPAIQESLKAQAESNSAERIVGVLREAMKGSSPHE